MEWSELASLILFFFFLGDTLWTSRRRHGWTIATGLVSTSIMLFNCWYFPPIDFVNDVGNTTASCSTTRGFLTLTPFHAIPAIIWIDLIRDKKMSLFMACVTFIFLIPFGLCGFYLSDFIYEQVGKSVVECLRKSDTNLNYCLFNVQKKPITFGFG